MAPPPGNQWYLEIQGKKTGPFTADQIHGLFRDQEIPGTARVTSDALGKWITVQEMVQSTKSPGAPKPFVPPPRPSSEITSINLKAPPPSSSAPDPTASLFEALQAAKERKQGPAKTTLPRGAQSDGENSFLAFAGPLFEAVPARAWIVAIAAVLLGTMVWGIQRFARQMPNSAASLPPPSTTSVQTTTTRPFGTAAPAASAYAPPPANPSASDLSRRAAAPPAAPPAAVSRFPRPAPDNPGLAANRPFSRPTPPHNPAVPAMPNRFNSPPGAASFGNHNYPAPVAETPDDRAANVAPPSEPPTPPNYPEENQAPPQVPPPPGDPNLPPPPDPAAPGPLE